MASLRSKYFQKLEEIHRDIECLSKLCKLPIVKRKFSVLWKYAADDKKFTSHIIFVVNRLNQIINVS